MQIVPFDSKQLPAHIRAATSTAVVNPFAAAVGGGFPVVSIKGKVFHIVRGDERTLVTKPDADDEPAANVEVVIIAVNPAKVKTYYSGGYAEGSADKPVCYSNDGVKPASDSAEPQAKNCATCPQNVFGSRITENGKKAKACSDAMRLAIAPAGQLNDPMLLRVPATTLPVLGEYGAMLAKKGYKPEQVVTKIGFDYSVAHPALTFKAVGFVTDEMMEEIAVVAKGDVVAQITGVVGGHADEVFQQEAPAPKPKAAKVKVEPEDEPAPAPAPKATKATKPKVKVEQDDDIPVAPKAAKAAAEPMTVSDIEAGLDNLDFDD